LDACLVGAAGAAVTLLLVVALCLRDLPDDFAKADVRMVAPVLIVFHALS
jgi:hypothetical protein